MSNIYIPAQSPEDWKQFLADQKHWRDGFSAKTLAYSWHATKGFPREVSEALDTQSELRGMQALVILPEHKVALDGGSRASQNDVWVLGRTEESLASISVEGKVGEDFGPTLEDWRKDASEGKNVRFTQLCRLLGIEEGCDSGLRYQLFHRTASAILEAERFHARIAVMLVHSFDEKDYGLQDYKRFCEALNVNGDVGTVTDAGFRSGVRLYLGWVRGVRRDS